MALPRRKQNFMEGAAVLTLAVAATKVIGAVYKIPLGNLLDKDGMAHFYVAYNNIAFCSSCLRRGCPWPFPAWCPGRRPWAE